MTTTSARTDGAAPPPVSGALGTVVSDDGPDIVLETGSSLLSPVHVPSVVDEIADRLVTAIAIGELLPGTRLPAERELASMMKVSRTTLREAVARVTALNLVESRRGRNGGIVVTQAWTAESAPAVRRTLAPKRAELAELFDLTAMIEATVARAAAERRSDEDLADMRRAVDDFADANDQATEQAADNRFHAAVMRACGNQQLVALNRDLLAKINLGFPMEPWRDPALGGDGSRRALAEHRAMLTAIEDHNVERAGAVAHDHTYISADIIDETLARADAALAEHS